MESDGVEQGGPRCGGLVHSVLMELDLSSEICPVDVALLTMLMTFVGILS